jgi:hypothetical protein
MATLAATVLLVVLVSVGLFVRATNDPGAAVTTLFHIATPTPTAILPLGSADVYLSNGAPWGTVTLDGQRRTPAELQGAMLRVSRGRHHLDYHARYFPSLRCVFNVPQSQSDTCPLDTSPSAAQFLIGQGVARIINLGSTGATLQPDQLLTLTRLVDSQLRRQAQTTDIAVGDRYWDGSGHVVTATAPLRFGLSEALSDTPNPGTNNICYQFCPNPTFISGNRTDVPNPQGWAIRVTVTYAWTLTDGAGRSITTPNYFAGQRYSSAAPSDALIALTASGWSVSGLVDLTTQGIVAAAVDALDQAAAGEGGGDYSTSFMMTTNPLDGCVMGVQYHGSTARLLWRFGALFTADDAARSVFPQLPAANAAEQAQVTRILTTPDNHP